MSDAATPLDRPHGEQGRHSAGRDNAADGKFAGPGAALVAAGDRVLESEGDPGAAKDGYARLAAIDLNLLVPMLALLEERSVTGAAARVGMTQSALSHALRRMRRLVGDELLVRQGSGMALTPRGLELVNPLRRALRQTADVVRPSRFDPGTDRRQVTLGMTNSIAFALAGDIAARMGEQAPHMQLRLRTMPLIGPSDAVFTQDGVDALLLPRAFATSFAREPLYDDAWVVIIGPSAPDAPVEELIRTLPHVVLDAPGYRVRPYEVLDRLGIRYEVRARVSDNLLVPRVVSAIGGVGFHRLRVIRQTSEALALRVHEFPFPIDTPGIDVVWNPWLTDSELRTWLGAILRDAVEATAPE
ncbi:MAG: LysR family transcriptional regulator [Dermatophilus congolensis]|nr:LysR family transcriptional regulator [Dermatophilus congolensis]